MPKESQFCAAFLHFTNLLSAIFGLFPDLTKMPNLLKTSSPRQRNSSIPRIRTAQEETTYLRGIIWLSTWVIDKLCLFSKLVLFIIQECRG